MDGEELDALYPVGETIITWVAIDSSGNMEECTQTVTVSFIPSEENEITSFVIDGQIGETEIDQENNTIQLVVPIGTDVTALIPEFEISTYATAVPGIGIPIDFSTTQAYIVTAQDGTSQEWIVEVQIEEDVTAPTFEVNGNTSDFTTELEVGDTYVVGLVTNIVDESITTTEITGDELVDTSQEGGPFTVIYQVSDGVNTYSHCRDHNYLFTIEEGMQIDINSLPTMHLDIRANTTEDVESVRLSIAGALSNSRTESLLPYAMFQDLPIGDYKGSDFVIGDYTGYSNSVF
ncbi:hypothetical protein GQR58_029091 [Nymphon striatum]|nr:hypothetical protein GQR58_029091 [Nymphon striatum]